MSRCRVLVCLGQMDCSRFVFVFGHSWWHGAIARVWMWGARVAWCNCALLDVVDLDGGLRASG
eukprot:1482451-Alexandrium_andersonii.AAC.1